jgi:membrane protease YdiL (CAAX protease family)
VKGPAAAGGEGAPGEPPFPGRAEPWKVRHAVAALAAGLAGSVLAALAVAAGGITSFEAFAVVGPAQSLAIIGVVAWLARVPPPGREPLGLRFVPVDAWGLLAGAGLQIALSLALSWVVVIFFGGEAPVQEVVRVADEAAGPGTRVAVVVTAVLIVPLAEELVFRGVLLRALARRFAGWVTVTASAAAFAAVHLLDPNAVLAVPALFVMGLVLGRRVLVSGRLGGAVAVHAGFNLLSVLFLFLY